ncbi:unnamed protein product [Ostreobium quekettii]|uniref:Uncharacterized protein n=1 Tax=Ostreobium quekettii TaxID=121088 RepID=A0A8S1JDC8_9CHLO|nr:unnamed protein product [Ostreobium quekettii]
MVLGSCELDATGEIAIASTHNLGGRLAGTGRLQRWQFRVWDGSQIRSHRNEGTFSYDFVLNEAKVVRPVHQGSHLALWVDFATLALRIQTPSVWSGRKMS